MGLSWLLVKAWPRCAHLLMWWRGLSRLCKIAIGISLLLLGGVPHLGTVVAGHISERAAQRAAAAAALYMDSFVERHAQGLSTKEVLSEDERQALERLLSPAAIHRPIVAFRIWKGDTVVFSNERELIGKTFTRTPTRDRAWHGQMAFEFEQLDGDDDDQVRALNLPILEIYAPIRERGTGRIIALVETYEIGVELRGTIRSQQLVAWISIVAIALLVVLLQFSFVGKLAKLSRLRAESEQNRQRIRHANLHVSEMNERTLRRFGKELSNGPAQCLELALLKFDSLDQVISQAFAERPLASGHKEDVEIIRRALDDALCRTRNVAGQLLLADIEQITIAEMLARIARHHERRTGSTVTFESRELPEHLPLAVKACLYHFALESLDRTSSALSGQSQSIDASCKGEKLVLEIIGAQRVHLASRTLATGTAKLRHLRDRIEAVGGSFKCTSSPAGGIALVAELRLDDMELSDA